jgi:type III secretion system YscQ/HrcQ family protein
MPAAPFTFDGLPYLRGEEVRLWNWFHRVFPGEADWRQWASGAFSQLLMRPGGQHASVTLANSLEPGQEERIFTLHKDVTSIGRAPENEIVLPAKAIGKHHARIVRRAGAFLVEDLGSAFGTQVGSRKLEPNRPEPLRHGDRFMIFPYELRVSVETEWAPESAARVMAWPAVSTDWRTFAARSPAGSLAFPVYIHPLDEPAHLEGSAAFFAELVRRLLQPLCGESPEVALLHCDEALVEFTLLSVLEAANRAARFPFQIELGPSRRDVRRHPETRGVATAFSVGLSALTGAFRLFVSYRLLERMEASAPAGECATPTQELSWAFPVCAGWVDLLVEELARVEPRDILLFASEPCVLFPGTSEKGWKCSLESDNPWRVRIDNYFDRSARMQEDTGPAPDLGTLPLRLHVVVGEKELTLAEANGLAPNTILELGAGKSDPVRLAINGRIVGQGELVEVDGKLGVRILKWS